MANRVIRSPSAVRGRSQRKTQWIGSSDSTATQTLLAGASVLDQSFAISTPRTVVRTRGALWVKSDQSAATEIPFGALGMSVVTQQAVAAGVASVPTPITDEGDDTFFLWQPFLAGMVFASAVGLNADMWFRYDFDSKAQRKVMDGTSIIVTLENASAADGLEYVIKFRQLHLLV